MSLPDESKLGSATPIKQSELFVERVTDAVPCLIYVYDVTERRDVYINSQVLPMLGYTSEQILAMSSGLGELFHPDDAAQVRDVVRRLGENDEGTAVIIECRMKHAAGHWVWVRSRNLVFEKDAEGHPSMLIGAAIDITDQKLAEQRVLELDARLEHASKLTVMGTTLASIAHELHQPLAAIANYASGCARVLSRSSSVRTTPADLVDKVRRISDEAIRAGNIIRRLQAFLRMREPSRESVDLSRIIDDALDLTEPLLKSREIVLEKSHTPDLPTIKADGVQLTQVVLNLIVNAADACAEVEPARRRIAIRTGSTVHDEVEVAVSDHAGTLDPELTERAFEQFFTTKEGNLGMGLAICRSIVEGHGGRIRVLVHPGRSSTFKFTLPIVAV